MTKLENNKINWTYSWVLEKILQTLSPLCATLQQVELPSLGNKLLHTKISWLYLPNVCCRLTYGRYRKTWREGQWRNGDFYCQSFGPFAVEDVLSSWIWKTSGDWVFSWAWASCCRACTTTWAWLQLSIILLPFRPSHITPFFIIRQARFSYLSRPLYVH